MPCPTVYRLLAMLLALSLLPALPVTAEEETRDTHGEVRFIPGSGPVTPLDPDFPELLQEDYTSILMTNDGDSLSLNVIPIFHFARADGGAFPARLVGDGVYPLYRPRRPYAQISDLRGTGGGWKLSLRADSFQRDGIPALQGAVLRLWGGTARSSNPQLTPPAIRGPLAIPCSDESAPVTVVDTLDSADSMGAWLIRWYPLDSEGEYAEYAPAHDAGVELYIPSGSMILEGSYYTTLYWTLSDTA